MKIGTLDIGSKAILAPMAEVTDAPFRTMCREHGAGLTFTQMISAKGVSENSFDTLKFLAFSRNEKPIGVQMLGGNIDNLGAAVEEIRKLKPDVIDLNCGCSVAQVCKYNMGARLLDDPVYLGKLVRRMVDASGGIPVSVKIRLGASWQKINVIENARQIEKNGASFITVHARTRADIYANPPVWEWIKKVKQSVSIPVVGNGSLMEPADCLRMIEQTGCDGVFIARGALGNPFIFERFNALMESGADPGHPDADTVLNTVVKHLELLVRDAGEPIALNRAKKHILWYYRYFNGITHLLENIFQLNDKSSVIGFLSEHTEKIKNNIYPEEDFERIKRSFNERVLFWINTQMESY